MKNFKKLFASAAGKKLVLFCVAAVCVAFVWTKSVAHPKIRIAPDDPWNKYGTSSEVRCFTDKRTSFLILLGVHKKVILTDVGGFKAAGRIEGIVVNRTGGKLLIETECTRGFMVEAPPAITFWRPGKICICETSNRHSLTNGVVRLINSRSKELVCEIRFNVED